MNACAYNLLHLCKFYNYALILCILIQSTEMEIKNARSCSENDKRYIACCMIMIVIM